MGGIIQEYKIPLGDPSTRLNAEIRYCEGRYIRKFYKSYNNMGKPTKLVFTA
jgi:hypothetical protein